MDLQLIPYTDKSFAVFGDTKTWKNNLLNLGGRFNRNLGGNAGFIFSNKKAEDVQQFINSAAAGQVQPLPDTARVTKTNQPRAAQSPGIPLPAQQTQPYQGHDGKYYQVVNYTVEYPVQNQGVTIVLGDNNIPYYVKQIENTQLPVDSILIEATDGSNLARAILVKGVWKVENMTDEHKLDFSPIVVQ